MPDPICDQVDDVIHDTVPDGIELKSTPYGMGLFATRAFPAGATLYVGRQLVIPNVYREFTLVTNQGTFALNTDTHSVCFSETQRWLYLFDSFMNHACCPTTISVQTPDDVAKNTYATVAVRDIVPGDQITCDYNLFEYDATDKIIERCMCGAPDCLTRIAGFRYLTRAQQKARIQWVDDAVLLHMAHVDPTFLYVPQLEDRYPHDRITLVRQQVGYCMLAARDYAADEVIFANESVFVPDETSIVVQLCGQRVWLDNLMHTVNRGAGLREFYVWDTFQNHACEPNTAMRYDEACPGRNRYELVASKAIKAGEELTSDYETFDSLADGTEFECLCGSPQCRKIIHG
jgi:hypothetical protein